MNMDIEAVLPAAIDQLSPFGLLVETALWPDSAFLRRSLREHRLLVLRRSRPAEPEEILQLASSFGEVFVNRGEEASETRFHIEPSGRIMRVSNELGADGTPRGLFGDHDLEWHHDFAHTPGDFHGTLIYNHRGGEIADTLFCDTERLLQECSEDDRTVLRETSGLHQVSEAAYRDTRISERALERLRRRRFRAPHLNYSQHCIHDEPTVRPLVPRHPFRSSEALYLGFATLSETRPRLAPELLAKLKARAEEPALQYKHAWRPHDVIVFDNLSTMHRRGSFQGERELWRVQFDYREIAR